MKSDVDTRVVRMEFDNKQFEKNVKKSTKSINDLKQTLDFKGVGESIDRVKVKFSALQIVATTAIAAITTKVVNLGITMVKSLSVDNIASGWAKYGEKTISVATMMAQKIRIAGEEITDLAKKTEVVNEQLEKLTWFSDETSYSFTDMTNYVGKFIAAGQDLDKSVKAMEGIATWAALSGQNSQVASRAMMQLAQAMGRSINRQDWSSIQTANMDTEKFREKVLETAVDLGELRKEGEMFVTKTGKKFDKAGFLKYFSEGWFTTDVLVTTLNKYSSAVDEVYEISIREGLTATEVLEKYGDQFDEFAIEAFRAAQEARTFKDVINAVKDAVSSKWMTTFETIFGNKDESVKLWSKLANELYDAFAESGNFRNNVLAAWKEMKGREDIFGEDGAFWNLYYALRDIRDLIKEAWNTIFPLTEMEDENDQVKDLARTLKAITKQINDFTKKLVLSEKASQRLSKVFKGLFSIIQVGVFALKAIKYVLDPVLYTLKALANQTLNRILALSGGIEKILNYIYKAANNLNAVMWDLMEILNPSGLLTKFFNFVSKLWAIVVDYQPITRLTKFIENLFTAFKEGGGTTENLAKIFRGILSLISIVGKVIIQLAKAIVTYVLPVLDKVIDAVSYLVGFLGGVAVSIIATISDIITAIDDALSGGNLDNVGESIKDFLNFIPQAVKSIIPILQSLWVIVKALVDVVLLIPKMLDAVSRKLTGKGIIDNLVDFFNSFSVVIRDFIDGIESNTPAKTGSLQGLMQAFIFFFQSIGELLKGLIATAQWLTLLLGATFRAVGKALQALADVLVKIFSGKWTELTSAQRNMVRLALILGTIVLVAWMLWSVFWRLINVINPLGAITDSLVTLIDKISFNALAVAINTFASAILKFAVSLYILNAIDAKFMQTFMKTLLIVGSILAILYFLKDTFEAVGGVITTFAKKGKETGNKVKEAKENSSGSMKELRKLLTTVGNLLLKMALAAVIFDKLEDKEGSFNMMIKTLLIITGIAGAFLAILKIFNKQSAEIKVTGNESKKSVGQVIAMIATMLIALKVLAKTAIMFKDIDVDAWKHTMTTFGIIAAAMILMLGMIALILQASSNREIKPKDKTKFLQIIAIIGAITSSIVLLSGAVAGLVAISTIGDITQAAIILGAIAAGLLIMVGAMVAISKIDTSISQVAQVLLILGGIITAIISIVAAMSIVARMNLPNVLVAFVLIEAMLITIAIIIDRLMHIRANTKRALQSFMLLGAMTALILALAVSLRLIANMPWEQILIGLGALIGAIIILSVITAVLTTVKADKAFVFFGAGLVAISLGLVHLAAALNLYAGMDLKTIGKGLLIVVGAVAALVAVSYLAKAVIPIMILISVAIMILASAVLSVALAMQMFTSIIETVIAHEEDMLKFFEILAKGIMTLVKAVIIGITEAVSESLVIIVQTVGRILAVIADVIVNNIVPLVSAISELVRALLEEGIKVLLEYGPKLGIAAFEVVLQILEYIAANADRLFTAINTIVFAGLESLIAFLVNRIPVILNIVVGLLHNLIQGLISNLPMILNDIIDLVKAVVNAIAEALPQLITTILGAVKTLIVGLWNGIMDVFGAEGAKITEEKINEIFSKITDACSKIFTIVSEILSRIGPILGDIITLIARILERLQPIIDAILYLVETIIQKIDWDIVLNFIATLASWIGKIIELLAPLFDLLNPILKLIMSIFTLIIDVVGPVLTNILELLDPIVQILSFIIELVSELVGPLFKTLMQFISLIGNTLNVLFVTHDLTQLKDLWSGFFANMGEMWSNFGRNVAEIASNMWSGLVEWFKNGGENVLKGLIEGLNNMGIAVKSWFGTLWDNIKKWFCDAFGIHSPSTIFADYGKNIIQGLINGLGGMMSNLKDKVVDICLKIKDWFTEQFNKIKSWFSDTWNDMSSNISSNASNVWSNVTSTFQNVTSTVGNAVSTAWNTVTTTVSNTANGMVDWFKNLFGIHSPSTVFADIGKNLILGLGVGMEKQANDYSTKSTINKVCSKVLTEVQDILDADENDITISVGLDISNVEEKANRVQDIMGSVSRDINMSAYGMNAGKVSTAASNGRIRKDDNLSTMTTNNNVTNTNNNVFNIKSTNPKEAADEIDKILQEKATKAKLARGGI